MWKTIKNLRESHGLLQAAILFGLLILVGIIFAQKIELSSVDLGRHLENGRLVFENTDVLFKNFYSYTEPEAEFINHHWLGGVIFYFVYLFGGFKLLSVFNILLAIFTFFLFFKLAYKKAGFLIPAFLSIPIIFLFSERIEIRPEVFSYLFLALAWIVFDNKNLSRKKRLLFLIPTFILWANIHIYFFIGLAFVFFKLVNDALPEFLKQTGGMRNKLNSIFLNFKSRIIDFLLLISVCLLTPNHVWGLLYPLNIFKNYGYQVAENKSIFFLQNLMLNDNFQIFKLLLALLIIGLISSGVILKKINWFNVLFSLFISLLALFASRNLALFGLVALVIISYSIKPAIIFLKDKLIKLYSKFIVLSELYLSILMIILIFSSIIFLIFDYSGRQSVIKGEPGLGLRSGSEDSFKFFINRDLQGPIFNNYDSGSALIFGLVNREKVFVDNRPEAYSSRFFTETYLPMQTNEEIWKEVADKYKFKIIYFSHTDSTPWGRNFLTNISKDNDWSLVYFDNFFVILVSKKNTPSEILDKYAIDSWKFRDRFRKLSNTTDLKSQFYLADFAQSFGYPDLAEEIYNKIIITYPRNERVILSLAYLYAASTDRSSLLKSIGYFERALKKENKVPGAYNQLALVYWHLADYKNAEYNWLKAKKINRQDSNALYYLNQVDNLKKRGMLPLN